MWITLYLGQRCGCIITTSSTAGQQSIFWLQLFQLFSFIYKTDCIKTAWNVWNGSGQRIHGGAKHNLRSIFGCNLQNSAATATTVSRPSNQTSRPQSDSQRANCSQIRHMDGTALWFHSVKSLQFDKHKWNARSYPSTTKPVVPSRTSISSSPRHQLMLRLVCRQASSVRGEMSQWRNTMSCFWKGGGRGSSRESFSRFLVMSQISPFMFVRLPKSKAPQPSTSAVTHTEPCMFPWMSFKCFKGPYPAPCWWCREAGWNGSVTRPERQWQSRGTTYHSQTCSRLWRPRHWDPDKPLGAADPWRDTEALLQAG